MVVGIGEVGGVRLVSAEIKTLTLAPRHVHAACTCLGVNDRD